MVAQVLFLNGFSKKDLHLNTVKKIMRDIRDISQELSSRNLPEDF